MHELEYDYFINVGSDIVKQTQASCYPLFQNGSLVAVSMLTEFIIHFSQRDSEEDSKAYSDFEGTCRISQSCLRNVGVPWKIA